MNASSPDPATPLIYAKADAEVIGVRLARQCPNVTLLTEAKVQRLHTSSSGREVTVVETDVAGEVKQFRGDIVVVACGAINSAALLLRSHSNQHPNGLANGSDQAGRNFMKHNCGMVVGLPADTRAHALWVCQTTIVVQKTTTAAQQLAVSSWMMSPVITISEPVLSFKRGFLMPDPDGHLLRIVLE